jgi:riboflavin kinase / FMN adenylyltransferase
MIFHSRQIKGQGRGHSLGFPTINLEIPPELVLDEGVYAVWVVIGPTTYKGAFHYGSIPTFDQSEKSMEVYLLDVSDETAPTTENILIEIDIVEYLREVKSFADPEDLMNQIARDIQKVNEILK